MPYTVYKSDGTPITIADNTVDQRYNEPNLSNPAATVGIQLLGRNVINYGTPTAQNFLQLTENFCGSQEPDTTQPLQGQLWFKKTSSTAGNLYVRYSSSTSGVFGDKWAQVITSDNPTAINSLLPSQTGQSGKYLTTNGTNVSWGSPGGYTLPPATSSVLGGVKVGSGLAVTPDGTLSATGGGGGGTTYTISATSAVGGAFLRLDGSDSSVDTVKFAGSGAITVTRTDANTITIGGGGGTVTEVTGTGTVNGITLTGSVTSTGSLTLGGTLSNVNLASQVTGVLPTANGGTGQTSATAAINALLPSQSGNAGSFLTTNGSNVSWAPGGSLLSPTGYIILGGLMMQWGSTTEIPYTTSDGNSIFVPFPTSFGICFGVQATRNGSGGASGDKRDDHSVHSVTPTGFSMMNNYEEMPPQTYYWLAYGTPPV